MIQHHQATPHLNAVVHTPLLEVCSFPGNSSTCSVKKIICRRSRCVSCDCMGAACLASAAVRLGVSAHWLEVPWSAFAHTLWVFFQLRCHGSEES